MAASPPAPAKRKKIKRKVQYAHVYIHAGQNNTIVTFTDETGNALCWSSCGACGFKGSRKSTPYAAKVTSEAAAEKAVLFGVEKVSVFVNGLGPGREQAIRGLQGAGLDFDKIVDATPIPHGGCRQKRRRRV
ncbi:30S ribosomal protein S11 [Candidatus Peribacteria bacterium]|nr:30S ribosomal protein S11 [Candidatus Peribacteria bacterium]